MLTERVSKPWLLFGLFYSATETAMNEINQKKNLDAFTRSVSTQNIVITVSNVTRNCIKSLFLHSQDHHDEA
jgi:hypothetical protein